VDPRGFTDGGYLPTERHGLPDLRKKATVSPPGATESQVVVLRKDAKGKIDLTEIQIIVSAKDGRVWWQ
jgi:hypothetical protein